MFPRLYWARLRSGADERRRRGHVLTLATLWVIASAWSAWADASPCTVPANLGDDLQSGSLTDARVEVEALCSVLRGVAEGPNDLHSLLIARNGRLIAELYRSGPDRSLYSLFASEKRFGPTHRHDMRSISKSVVGLLVGIILKQGELPNLSSPICDVYPEWPNLRDVGHNAITLEHLLTMSSGLEWHESVTTYGSLANDETRLFWDWSPIHFVLSRPIAAPAGSQFNYNGGGTTVIGDVLVRTSKLPLRDLARTYLFEPLGIKDWEWIGDLYGRPVAFAGLRLRPRDLLKIGQMMLDHGQWRGRQIVPTEWITQSIRPHIASGPGLGYGYFWWTGSVEWQGQRVPWGAAFGNGGQRLFVVPALNLTVAITAGAYNDPSIARKEMEVFQRIVATVRR
jgi:CubicO group peptidase (beta-lactamase class C family)